MGNMWAKSRDAADAADAQRALANKNQDDQAADEDKGTESRGYGGPTISGLASAMSKAERDRRRGLPVLSGEFTLSSTTSGSSDAGTDNLLNCGNCDTVATLDKPLLLCGRCGEQHYCSRNCQKAHWSEHKKRCLTPTPA
jgi:hypothetical protein